MDVARRLIDQAARINPMEVSTCHPAFSGFETTNFQLDWAARIDSTENSYIRCVDLYQNPAVSGYPLVSKMLKVMLSYISKDLSSVRPSVRLSV